MQEIWGATLRRGLAFAALLSVSVRTFMVAVYRGLGIVDPPRETQDGGYDLFAESSHYVCLAE
jgi:hypothetical protein